MNQIYSFTIEDNDGNIEYMIERLRFFNGFFEDRQIIDFISSHFYKIESNKLMTLPKSILYSIISNPKLIINNEDSLLEFINQLFLTDKIQNHILFLAILDKEKNKKTSLFYFMKILSFHN